MRIGKLFFGAALALTVGGAQASVICVMDSGNTALNSTVKAVLESEGHDVIMGPTYWAVTSNFDYFQFDAVYLTPNYNWSTLMNAASEQHLRDFVEQGGGLVVSEWMGWMIGQSASYWPILRAAYPMTATTSYSNETSLTYNANSTDPVMTSGMPSSFTFNTTNIAGVVTRFPSVRSGATAFYTWTSGTTTFPAVGGWNYGLGRVIAFGIVNGPTEMQNADFKRLFANAFRWTAGKTTTGPGIKGKVDLRDYFGGEQSDVLVTYHRTDNNYVVGRTTTTIAADGSFTALGPNIPGTYKVGIKARHWLRKIVGPVTTVVNTTPDIGTVSVINGDCDNDNVVTIFDYVLLSSAFDKSIGDAGYNADADLDGDGTVTIFDYLILSNAFDQFGD
ncbi:MAG: hypothetical protein JST40_04335 [Armatimonadetes bacterium]|nr:hypothetical protein [Armatimonadota bacterium]